MATTEELLLAAEAEESEEESIDYLIVDSEERTITVPSSETVFGVFSDNTVERKYFLCPRYVVSEKMDMVGSTVKINFISSGGNIGTYTCQDVAEYEDDGDYVTFSWKLEAAVFDGNKDTTISFAIKATDGTNVFNTQMAKGTVYETIEVETLYSQYAALLLQIIAMIDPDIDATDDDAIIAGIKAIVDSADEATGTGETTIAEQLATLIEGYGRGDTVEVIPDGYADITGVTATAANVLSGKTFVDSSGATVTGTMTNRGAVTATIDGINTTSYTIPAGYHNGSGTVSLTSDISDGLAEIAELLGGDA